MTDRGANTQPAAPAARDALPTLPSIDDQDVSWHLGKALHARRRSMGLTLKDVADRAGISFQQVHKYECGDGNISVARLLSLAEALEAPPASFFKDVPRPS